MLKLFSFSFVKPFCRQFLKNYHHSEKNVKTVTVRRRAFTRFRWCYSSLSKTGEITWNCCICKAGNRSFTNSEQRYKFLEVYERRKKWEKLKKERSPFVLVRDLRKVRRTSRRLICVESMRRGRWLCDISIVTDTGSRQRRTRRCASPRTVGPKSANPPSSTFYTAVETERS